MNETSMETAMSVVDLAQNAGIAVSESRAENPGEAERNSIAKSDLPEIASSNCENIPAGSEDPEENSRRTGEDVENREKNAEATKHFEESIKIEDPENLNCESLKNSADSSPRENSRDENSTTNLINEKDETAKETCDSAAIIENEKLSTEVEKPDDPRENGGDFSPPENSRVIGEENRAAETFSKSSATIEDKEKAEILVDDPRKNCDDSSPRENSWAIGEENREEASIEDSCEAQPAFSRVRSDERSASAAKNVRSQANSAAPRASTLSEDSRLVKIPLPTSSMNLIQSNAQFLNKSRNFLNFITERSTNIMEKTLLPQHIAVRYNSLLKLNDGGGGGAHERKTAEESAVESAAKPKVTCESDAENANSRDSRDAENSPRILSNGSRKENPVDETTSHLSDKLSPNSQSSDDDAAVSVSPRREISSPGTNESRAERSAESRLEDEDGESRLKRSGNDVGSESDGPGETARVSSDESLQRNPDYLTLVRDYAKAREEQLKLADRVKHLEARNRILEAQNSGELLNAQLETLEKTVERLSGELRLANANQDELGREYATANRERESMVMKYAVSEKQLIDTQRARDYAERRCKEITRDHELLQSKLRQAQSERVRICNILDTKCRELTDSQKEVERLKEDVNMRDVKLKWTQNKLKTEMEAQKETQQRLDKATTRINEMKEECELVRRESQEAIRKFQQSEENKAVTLDQQLKEQQARLIVERHVTEDKEMLRIQLQKEVDLLKKRQQTLIEENNSLSLKIQDLQRDRAACESKLGSLKIVADQRQKEIVDLSAKVSNLETLKLQLIHKEQCLASNEAEVERLRQVNQELEADISYYRQREEGALDYTEKVTDRNIKLQREMTEAEELVARLEREQAPLRETIIELRAKVKTLEEELAQERRKRREECDILARHVAEQTQLAQNLTRKLEDSQGEIAVLRRKQQTSVREMTRELQQCRKRLEGYESASPSNSLEPTSRAGSNTSLDTGETVNGETPEQRVARLSGIDVFPFQLSDIKKEVLAAQAIKVQKINVRLAEKNDFLEEHIRTLTAEIQKKTKILQRCLFNENYDALGSNETDQHKAELARHGGIMASVYNHRVSDEHMTLNLSLEINKKLQTVLEDTLLKNIMLKDNIDTLGEEIARLTIKNQQLLQQQKAK